MNHLLLLLFLLNETDIPEPTPPPDDIPEEINITVDNSDLIDYMEKHNSDTADKIIDYLEKKEEEKKKEEEAAQLAAEAAAEEQAELDKQEAIKNSELLSINAQYTNQNTVINGFANKYSYYLMYDVQVNVSGYTRTNKYVYCFTEYTNFTISNNNLAFDNGSCIRYLCDYNGQVSSTTLSEGDTINYGSLYNAYTNIDIIDYPENPNIDKTYVKTMQFQKTFYSFIFALFVGLSFIRTLIFNNKR